MKAEAANVTSTVPLFPTCESPQTIRTFDEAVAWFLRQNPDLETNRPQDLDWQAIKSEGRRF